MKSWTRAAVATAGCIIGGAAAAVAVGGRLWDRATADSVRRLRRDGPTPHPEAFRPEQLQGLPEPVARYFSFALTPGQPLLRSARVEQGGELRLGGFEAPWRSFTAVQHFSVDPPGFVWNASLRMAPFISVRVRDSYLDGVGSIHGRVAALIPVVDQSGGPELAAGSLHRYLAEAPWCPTALLPRPGLTWEAIDSTRACATLTDQRTTVSLEFHFASNGAIQRSYTPARYREVGGDYVLTPWGTSYRSYRPTNGMQVPLEGEVEWILPEGRLAVWRGRIRDIEYEHLR
jgi:hypothetical protein